MKRNWVKNIFRGFCLTSAVFVFQACYGTGPDNENSIYIEGVVKSKKTGAPLRHIDVSVADRIQRTKESGEFHFYIPKTSNVVVSFKDADVTDGVFYISKDTLIQITSKNDSKIELFIELEEQ